MARAGGTPSSSSHNDAITAAGAASYLAETIAALTTLSRQHGFDMLSYLLDMARMEAEQLSADRDHA